MAGRVGGKIALVTGAAQGLGEAIARMLAAEGARVALTDLNLEKAQAVADAINASAPGRAIALRHDVTDEAAWIDALKAVEAAFGGLHVLVNNAGISDGGSVVETSLEVWRKVHAVDVDSVFLGCKHAIPLMAKTVAAGGPGGSIVNISSIAGIVAGHNTAAYNSAKAAVWLYTKTVALEAARAGWNVRANSVHPVFIKTPILDPLVGRFGAEEAYAKLARQVPLGRIGEPDDVAYAVLFLASDESQMITGAELKVDGGISAM